MSKLKVVNNELVVATTKTPKAKATKTLYGVQLSTKPNLELRTALKVVKANADKSNLTFQFLYAEFKKEIIRGGNKVNKNTEGRLRRILYRSIESGVSKESIQGIKFNLSANFRGVKVIVKTPFVFGGKGDVSKSQVENNLYSFKVAKVVTNVKEAKIEAIKDKLNAFRKSL
jgi:hypothetical protein